MALICGADGCSGGWVVVIQDLESSEVSWRLAPDATRLVQASSAPQVLAIDIPIGLPERGPRECDLLARRLLAPRRASSVFPAPLRPMLAARTQAQAGDIRFQIEGKRMSVQAWNILGKIRDVDETLAADLAARVFTCEIHPELCFRFMAGVVPRSGKKTAAGRAERLSLLEPHFGGAVLRAALADASRLAAQPDDILDAFAALWTARRVAGGLAVRLPEQPPLDAKGLPMQILC